MIYIIGIGRKKRNALRAKIHDSLTIRFFRTQGKKLKRVFWTVSAKDPLYTAENTILHKEASVTLKGQISMSDLSGIDGG